MINPRIEDNRLILGKWTSVQDDGCQSAKDYKELYGGTLYGFIGMELHATQQGASKLFYRNMRVYAVRMEDTSGASVEESTMIEVDGDTFTVGELDADEKINWSALRTT